MQNFSIDNLKPNSHIHFIGIGGISMSALAHILISNGYRVSGSDANSTTITDKLIKSGVNFTPFHSADNITDCDVVCYTAAIPKTNPELVRAKEKNIPVLERAELLGQIMQKYKFPLAVAGTHGKTTTTSMLSLILMNADLDPTVLVGGELPQIGGNLRLGNNSYLVFEACEYVESFLHFNPFLSIITNIEEDHLDYFKDINHIISSFAKFIKLTDKNGFVILPRDDENAMSISREVECNLITYGIKSTDADFTATNIKLKNNGCYKFDVLYQGEKFVSLSLNVTGMHNVSNAVAATAAAVQLGIDKEAIKTGLEEFTGTKRRFEKLGELCGATIVDDYAHHPTEIEATLKSAKNTNANQVWCIFQPHTYSRTKAFLKDFAHALSFADKVIITDVYPAREKYDGTIHSCDLAIEIDNSVYMNDFKAIERYVKANIQENDLVITMGAGNVFKIGYSLCGID